MARSAALGSTKEQQATIENHWVHICRVLGPDRDPATIDYDILLQYVATRRTQRQVRRITRGKKKGEVSGHGDLTRGQTIVRELQALKRGLQSALRKKAIAQMPAEWPKVKRDPPREWQRGHLHEPEKVSAFLERLPPAARAQMTVAALTGLRAHELRRLSWSWVEKPPHGVEVPAILRVPISGAKTRTERLVALPLPALQALQDARQAVMAVDKAGAMPLMPGQYKKTYDRVAHELGYVKNITLRDVRHCYGTLALQHGGDAAATQAAMGHKQLATTQRYQTSTIRRTVEAGLAVAEAILPQVLATANPPTSENQASNLGPPGTRTQDHRLKSLVQLLQCELSLDNETIAEVLDLIANRLESGEVATGTCHRRVV